MIISADIGGTKTALGISTLEDPINFIRTQIYENHNYSSFNEILEEFTNKESISAITAGIAGPINSTRVQLTNLDWVLDLQILKQSHKTDVYFLNDLEVACYGIPYLVDQDIIKLNQNSNHSMNDVLVAIGTGLGKAEINHKNKTVYPSEAGHIGFSPRSKFQQQFMNYMLQKYKEVSYEMMISSVGFNHIRRYMLTELSYEISDEFQDLLRKTTQVSKTLFEQSLRPNDDGKICQIILDELSSVVGFYLADMVLIHLPNTIYLTGGIGRNVLNHKVVLNSFLKHNKMGSIMKNTGLGIITDPLLGLKGAAIYSSSKSK